MRKGMWRVPQGGGREEDSRQVIRQLSRRCSAGEQAPNGGRPPADTLRGSFRLEGRAFSSTGEPNPTKRAQTASRRSMTPRHWAFRGVWHDGRGVAAIPYATAHNRLSKTEVARSPLGY
jgi:hypothetical protein